MEKWWALIWLTFFYAELSLTRIAIRLPLWKKTQSSSTFCIYGWWRERKWNRVYLKAIIIRQWRKKERRVWLKILKKISVLLEFNWFIIFFFLPSVLGYRHHWPFFYSFTFCNLHLLLLIPPNQFLSLISFWVFEIN